jgi:hypothetical protein
MGEERHLVVLHFNSRIVIDLHYHPSAQTREIAAAFPHVHCDESEVGQLLTLVFPL